MAFSHRAHLDKSFLQILIPIIAPLSLLESESGFEIVTQRANAGGRPLIHIYIRIQSHKVNQVRYSQKASQKLLRKIIQKASWKWRYTIQKASQKQRKVDEKIVKAIQRFSKILLFGFLKYSALKLNFYAILSRILSR
jgi:hypothetical protein